MRSHTKTSSSLNAFTSLLFLLALFGEKTLFTYNLWVWFYYFLSAGANSNSNAISKRINNNFSRHLNLWKINSRISLKFNGAILSYFDICQVSIKKIIVEQVLHHKLASQLTIYMRTLIDVFASALSSCSHIWTIYNMICLTSLLLTSLGAHSITHR